MSFSIITSPYQSRLSPRLLFLSTLLLFSCLSRVSSSEIDSANIIIENKTIEASTTYGISLLTSNLSMGTQIKVKIPPQIQVNLTSGSVMPLCIVSVASYQNNLTLTVSNRSVSCYYSQANPSQFVTYTLDQNITGILKFALYFGQLVNPPACLEIDLFEVELSGGYPSGKRAVGLTKPYSPGSIFGAQVLSDSLFNTVSGSSDNYTFYFKISHNIPRGGYISVLFPSSTWLTPPISSSSYLKINLGQNDTLITNLTQKTSNPYQVLLPYLAEYQLLNASTLPNIVLKIFSISNPSTQGYTSSIIIQTLDNQQNVIDQSTSVLSVQINYPGSLQLLNFSVSSSVVDTTNLVSFSLNTTNALYSRGGLVEVVGPYPYISSTGFGPVCIAQYGFMKIGAVSCQLALNTYTVDMKVDADPQINLLNFAIAFINPLGQLQLPSFQIYFKNPDKSIVSTINTGMGYQTTAGACSIMQASLFSQNNTVSRSEGVIQLSFHCDHRIRSTGQVSIILPVEQMQYNPAMNCSLLGAPTLQIACLKTNNATHTNITLQIQKSMGLVDISPLYVFQLQFNNVTNPIALFNQQLIPSIQIFTYNQFEALDFNYYVIDQLTEGVYLSQSLTTGSILDFSVSMPVATASLTNSTSIYQFKFTTVSYIPQNGYITITFPPRTAYVFSSLPNCSSSVSPLSFSCLIVYSPQDKTEIQSVQFKGVCPSQTGCQPKTAFSLSISSVYNLFNNQPNPFTTFMVQSSTSNGYFIGSGSYTLPSSSLTPNSLIASILSPSGIVINGALDNYRFQVQNINNKIPTGVGSLVITFPAEIAIQDGASCYAQSSVILICRVNGQALNVTSNSDIQIGTVITVNLNSGAFNPKSNVTSSPFLIQTLYYGTYLIDQMNSLTVASNTPNYLTNFLPIRSSVLTNAIFQLKLCFNTSNPIPTGAFIDVIIPKDQAVLVGQTVTSSQHTIPFLASTVTISKVSFTKFSLTEWCSKTGSCGPNTQQCTFIDGFKNPSTTAISLSSVTVSIRSGLYTLTDVSQPGITLIPLVSESQMTVNSIVRSTNTITLSPGYVFSFTLAFQGSLEGLTSPSVTFYLPPNMLYTKQNQNPTCAVSSDGITYVPQTCTQSIAQDLNGNGPFITSLTVPLTCSLSTVTCYDLMYISVSGTYLQNPYDTSSFYGQIVSVATSYLVKKVLNIKNSGYLVLGQVDVNGLINIPSFQPTQTLINSIYRTPTTVDSVPTVTFNITLPTRVSKGGFINLQIPLTEFIPSSSSFLYQVQNSSGFYTQSKLAIYLGTDSNFINLQFPEWCSGTGKYCPDNVQLMFIIVSGLQNARTVGSFAPNTYILSTQSSNRTLIGSSNIAVSAYPQISTASINIVSVQLSQNQVALSEVALNIQIQCSFQFISTDILIVSFTGQFVRNDLNVSQCFDVSFGNFSKPCVIQTTNNVTTSIQVSNFCSNSNGCVASNSYTLQVTRLINILEQVPFLGTMTVSMISMEGYNLGVGSYNLANYPTLSPAPLSCSITRSTPLQSFSADFTLTLTTPPNSILLVGTVIQLQLPINQIQLQFGLSSFTAKSGQAPVSLTYSLPTSNYLVASFQYVGCGSLNCVGAQTYQLTLGNSKNPYIQVENYNDFVVKYYSNNNNLIFQSTSPLMATPSLQYGLITNLNVTNLLSTQINAQVGYLISFVTPNDLPINGQFKLIFPENRVQKDPTTLTVCTLNGLPSITQTIWETTAQNTQILTINSTSTCAFAQCQSGKYSFRCTGGMKNPSSVNSIANDFLIQGTDSSGQIISQGSLSYSFLNTINPALINVTLTVQEQYFPIGKVFGITFATVSLFPKSAYVRIVVPVTQAIMPVYDLYCLNGASFEALDCGIVYGDGSQIWVEMKNQFCVNDCLPKQQIKILLGLSNYPNEIFSLSSVWQVYTLNSRKEALDGTVAGVKPQLTACS